MALPVSRIWDSESNSAALSHPDASIDKPQASGIIAFLNTTLASLACTSILWHVPCLLEKSMKAKT
jgi:hypothetical protein